MAWRGTGLLAVEPVDSAVGNQLLSRTDCSITFCIVSREKNKQMSSYSHYAINVNNAFNFAHYKITAK